MEILWEVKQVPDGEDGRGLSLYEIVPEPDKTKKLIGQHLFGKRDYISSVIFTVTGILTALITSVIWGGLYLIIFGFSFKMPWWQLTAFPSIEKYNKLVMYYYAYLSTTMFAGKKWIELSPDGQLRK